MDTVMVPTFAPLLHVRAVVWTCQHRHRVAAVLSGETVLKASRHRVVEYVKGKLGDKENHSNGGKMSHFTRLRSILNPNTRVQP